MGAEQISVCQMKNMNASFVVEGLEWMKIMFCLLSEGGHRVLILMRFASIGVNDNIL